MRGLACVQLFRHRRQWHILGWPNDYQRLTGVPHYWLSRNKQWVKLTKSQRKPGWATRADAEAAWAAYILMQEAVQ